MYTVELSSLVKEYNLTVLTKNVDLTGKTLCYPEINRPALQLAGFYDYFDSDRLQVIGLVEYTYLTKMDANIRRESLKKIFEHKIPCIVLCRNLTPFEEMLIYGDCYDVPILSYSGNTSDFVGEVLRWLKVVLAPRVTIHGVLVDIYGEGILITGESGIGKSEAALELIKRGHRFVADDAVEIRKVSSSTLIGSCPELIKYFMELRGIGIIDIRQMFGVESIKATQSIDLVIKLELWDKSKDYDRLGSREEYLEILGNNVTCHLTPVRPGRNIAVICESAAINHRQKKMGYNAAKVLSERIISNMTK